MGRVALLCLVAGYVDAVGYIEFGGVFAANMTGNTVLLAIAGAQGEWHRVEIYVVTLGAFFLGALFASLVKRALGRLFVPLLLEAALLLLVDALVRHAPPENAVPLIALLAAAMGLQGASVTRFGSTGLNTVVVTTTIARLADGLVGWVWPVRRDAETPPAGWTVAISVAAWTAYGIGAAAAVILLDHFQLRAPLVAPALLVTAVAISLVKARAGP